MRSSVLAVVVIALGLSGCPETPSATPTPPVSPVPSAAAPAKPLVTKPQIADWCPEHGVPESVCTRCNEGLIAGFKAKKDWCEKHGLPGTQCIACHPEVEAKWKAMAPAEKK